MDQPLERWADIPDIYFALDEQGTILDINNAVIGLGYQPNDLVGRRFCEWVYHEDRGRVAGAYQNALAGGNLRTETHRFRVLTKDNQLRWFESHSTVRFAGPAATVIHKGVCRDITDLILEQESLADQVRMQTTELLSTNEALLKEIDERRAVEKALLDREVDLQREKAHLEDVNTTLKVLLKRREADKRELEEQIMYNVMKLIFPYLDKLRQMTDDERLLAYLSIVESNLNDITTVFARKLSVDYYGLSAVELNVADLIRQGKPSSEIARLMALSVRTVEAHRQGIRRKLRIQNKKVNLRTFLAAI